MTVKEREMLQMCGAGCSAVSWQTKDGCVLWGRNMDFNRMAQGSAPTFFPRGQVYYTCAANGKEILWRTAARQPPTPRWEPA